MVNFYALRTDELFDIAVFVMSKSDCTEVKSSNIPTVNIKQNDSRIPMHLQWPNGAIACSFIFSNHFCPDLGLPLLFKLHEIWSVDYQ